MPPRQPRPWPSWRRARHHRNLEMDPTHDEPDTAYRSRPERARLPWRAAHPRGSTGAHLDPDHHRHLRPGLRPRDPRHPIALHPGTDAQSASIRAGLVWFRGTVGVRVGVPVGVGVYIGIGIGIGVHIGVRECVALAEEPCIFQTSKSTPDVREADPRPECRSCWPAIASRT